MLYLLFNYYSIFNLCMHLNFSLCMRYYFFIFFQLDLIKFMCTLKYTIKIDQICINTNEIIFII